MTAVAIVTDVVATPKARKSRKAKAEPVQLAKAYLVPADLLAGLKAVAKLAKRPTPKPILNCILVTISKAEATFSAYDQEVSATFTTDRVDTIRPGSFLVNGEQFVSVLKACKADDSIVIEHRSEDGVETIEIRGSKLVRTLVLAPIAEYPPIKQPSGSQFTVDFADLHGAIESTVFATARENTRYAINGLLMEHHKASNGESSVWFVSTDGRRLAMERAAVTVPDGFELYKPAIIPTFALSLLSTVKLSKKQPAPRCYVSVNAILSDNGVNTGYVSFQVDGLTVTTVMVDGHFPRYSDVVPQASTLTIRVDADELAEGIKAVSGTASLKSKGVRLVIGSDSIKLITKTAEIGESTSRVTCERQASTIGDLTIGFNPDFLIEGLDVCKGQRISLKFTKCSKPLLMECGSWQYVVMPVNLS